MPCQRPPGSEANGPRTTSGPGKLCSNDLSSTQLLVSRRSFALSSSRSAKIAQGRETCHTRTPGSTRRTGAASANRNNRVALSYPDRAAPMAVAIITYKSVNNSSSCITTLCPGIREWLPFRVSRECLAAVGHLHPHSASGLVGA